tara:strand:- start:330 stop:830 length:501 start_codon:yes stop_codon:yes gene_type:complete
MAIDTGIGISIDLVSTTAEGAQAPLGQTLLKPAGTNGEGEQVWIYVQASEALVAGNVVCRKITAGALDADLIVQKTLAGMPADLVVGVAQHAIASGSFGWVLKSGQGVVLTDSGNAVGGTGGLIPGSNAVGTAEAAGATARILGVGIATTAAGGLLAPVILDCPSR